jgi:hypothetical protein
MILSVATFLFCLFSAGLIRGDMPVPTLEDMPGAEIVREEIFVGGALWGLINGGADLYYEYGFDRMVIQEIEWQGEEFRLELYRMETPGAAFGIFSVSVHGCRAGGPVTTGDCLNRFQYQFYSGNYYLSLINYSGSSRAQRLSVEIGSVIASAAGGSRIETPGFLSQDIFRKYSDRVRLIRGKLGFQNALSHLVSVFDGLDDYMVWYLKPEGMEDAEILLIEINEGADTISSDNLKLRLKETGFSAGSNNNRIVAVKSASGTAQDYELLRHVLAGSE